MSELSASRCPKQLRQRLEAALVQEISQLHVRSRIQAYSVCGLDVEMPGMLVALLKRSPLFGGKVKSFDGAAAMQVPGVVKVVQVPGGVAVALDAELNDD